MTQIVVEVGAVQAAAGRMVAAALDAVAVLQPAPCGDAVTDPAFTELAAAMRLALGAAHQALVTTCTEAIVGVASFEGVDERVARAER